MERIEISLDGSVVEKKKIDILQLGNRDFSPDLSSIEKSLAKMQSKLIDARGNLTKFIENESVQRYASELAQCYYPKKADNEDYLRPVVLSFAVDLTLAPLLHSKPQLWRYNYDDLDLLANFYKFAQKQNGYFHVAHGTLPEPTMEDLALGLKLLEIEIGDYLEELWNAYNLRGGRARVAARVIEAVSGLFFDEQMNDALGYAESESRRNLRLKNGLGKFRYLRRGREWMSIGTAASHGSVDLRKESISDLWGYQIRYDRKEQTVKISASNHQFKWAKAQMTTLLEKDTLLGMRLKNVSDFYREFYNERRFANATNWFQLDEWLLTRTKKFRRAMGKGKWKLYLAKPHQTGKITYLPRRTNFFWNISENLNCAYKLIWNPYRQRRNSDF